MPDAPTPAHELPTPPTPATPEPETMPTELQTPANTTGQQPFADDFNNDQNKVAGASRGEFGRQSEEGVTQGGYGNEASRGGATYAGTLEQPAATTGYVGEREQRPAGLPSTENGSFGTQAAGAALPQGSAVGTHFANDNAAPKGPDSGFAADYGTSSLGGRPAGEGEPDTNRRNQHEDYTPNHPEGGPRGLHTGAEATNATDGAGEADATPNQEPRSGYAAAGSPDAQGGTGKGFGSKGGSYNDEYDSAEAGQAGGSPSRGDFDRQDKSRNYGGTSDERTQESQSPDYGPAPGRTSPPDQA